MYPGLVRSVAESALQSSAIVAEMAVFVARACKSRGDCRAPEYLDVVFKSDAWSDEAKSRLQQALQERKIHYRLCAEVASEYIAALNMATQGRWYLDGHDQPPGPGASSERTLEESNVKNRSVKLPSNHSCNVCFST